MTARQVIRELLRVVELDQEIQVRQIFRGEGNVAVDAQTTSIARVSSSGDICVESTDWKRE